MQSNPFSASKNRIGERIAESCIRIVASLSILVIFLICIFVFREAATLFGHNSPAEASTTEAWPVAESDLAPEVYNPDSGPINKDAPVLKSLVRSDGLSPEVYNPDVTMASETPAEQAPAQAAIDFRPEIYNPDSGPEPNSTAPKRVVEKPQELSLWQNLTSMVWQPVGEIEKFGILPLLIGTAKTTLLAILIGAPLGIFAAMFVAFFATRRIREIVKPSIELLAGFPSVVIGFFCLTVVATFVQDTLGTEFRLNAVIGGFGLALAVVPIVFSITEDALSAVPRTYREASLALGSTEWQTAYRVMLPAAAPGVFAAVLLGIGRAFGETMIAIMATGNAALVDWSPITPARTIAATIGSEMGEVVWGSEHYGVLFFLGALLFVVSFALNAVTELYVKKRLLKKFQGA
jgi:phosphate transport system permease protein